MTEIPKDIRKAAYTVVERGYSVGLIEAVAAALLAERNRTIERCAEIADAESALALFDDTAIRRASCREIARAIRAQINAPAP